MTLTQLCSSSPDDLEFSQGAVCCHTAELSCMLFSGSALLSSTNPLGKPSPPILKHWLKVCGGQAFSSLVSNSPARLLLFPVSLNTVKTIEEVLHWNILSCNQHLSPPPACKTHFIPLCICGVLYNEQSQEWLVFIEMAHGMKSSHKLPYPHLH